MSVSRRLRQANWAALSLPASTARSRLAGSSIPLAASTEANFGRRAGTYSPVRVVVEEGLGAFSPLVFLKKPCLLLLPSSPFCTICVMKPGSLKTSRCSSFGSSS